MADKQQFRVAVIGAGPTGIAAGRELLRSGFTDFTIFDAQSAVGGTWQQHSYPGLACDVWAHSYTFTYAPNPDWSANFVGQAEIQAYLARCASAFGLQPYLRLNTRITSAHFVNGREWKLCTSAGEAFYFDIVISAMGNQHTPLYPDVDGIASFTGDSWHSTCWNHDVDLRGKRVVVVGSAASAVQIVPEIAPLCDQLTVLQRSANWIMPRHRKPYGRLQRWCFGRVPYLIALLRTWQGMLMSQVQHAVTIGHPRMGQFERMVHRFIDRSVADPALRSALQPDTPYGCKRGLVSDEFYPTLNRDNVELIPAALQKVTATGLVTACGRAIDADVIIYCTGYKVLDFDRFDVVGPGGLSLADTMAASPAAHKSVSVPGFPNYFLAPGPNGLVLTVPYFRTIEKTIATVVRLLDQMRLENTATIAVKSTAADAYSRWMRGRFSRYSWAATTCSSYYRTQSGHSPFLFPGDYREFCRQLDELELDDFDCSPRVPAATVAERP